MTTFFITGVDPQDGGAEAAYHDLCESSEAVAGCPAKARRIFSLNCRFDGLDCEIEVGKPLPHRSEVVLAILDHGREQAYVVHTDAPGAGAAVRVRRPVYAVTEFS